MSQAELYDLGQAAALRAFRAVVAALKAGRHTRGYPFAALKRRATSSQLTTFHHASM